MLKNSFYAFILFSLFSCVDAQKEYSLLQEAEETIPVDTVEVIVINTVSPQDIHLVKALLYDRYTLEDHYIYVDNKKDTIERSFQWEKVKERLAFLENFRQDICTWAVLQNYKNGNGESPTVRHFVRDEYSYVSDTFGVQRYQSVALYLSPDSVVPERYGRDGTPVKLLNATDSLSEFYQVIPATIEGEWWANKRQVKVLGDTLRFDHVIVVDVTNQSVAGLENKDGEWLIRSMNPATSGVYRPPYAQATPVGMYLIQQKKRKMVYLRDGSAETGGFAPYANRFTNGAYLHGIPSVHPSTREIEYSSSLGTTPRSHMCVRTASSHAKFVYDYFPIFHTVVLVID